MRTVSFLISSAAAAVVATTAFTAFAQTPTAFNWTGPYLGVNAGDDFDGATRFDRTTGAPPNNTSALALNLRPVSHAVHTGGFIAAFRRATTIRWATALAWAAGVWCWAPRRTPNTSTFIAPTP